MNYRIRTVAELTGVPRNTLIAWERRYAVVRPERNDNGYRSYSDVDVAKLKRVKDAIDTGLSISEAIARVEDGDKPARLAPPTAQREWNGTDPFHDVRDKLYDALTNYRGADAERLLSSLFEVAADLRIHRIFFPILRKIGANWESGQLSIAQEHYASMILREQMVGLWVGLGRRSGRGPRAACTTFVGDLHEFGAMAMAVRLSRSGYRTTHLGPNLPARSLGEFCRSNEPTLVCVSVILAQPGPVIVSYAEELRALAPKATRLVLGGRGISVSPLPRVDGVELIPDWDGFDCESE